MGEGGRNGFFGVSVLFVIVVGGEEEVFSEFGGVGGRFWDFVCRGGLIFFFSGRSVFFF